MTADEVKREIDGAAEMIRAWEEEYDISLSPSIHFTGGEPFLYRGMWDVITHATQNGFKIAILTNGCLVTEKDARTAAALGIADIQISLEGPPEIHDGIRGSGSFAAAVQGARHLIAGGNVVSANMTLSRLNVGKMEETAGIAKSIGFSGIGFSRLVPCGSGKNLLDSLLTSQEIRTAYEKMSTLSSPGFDIASGDPLAGIPAQSEHPPNNDLVLAGCSAAFSGVTITSDGSVMPCRRIGTKIGNLRQKSLRRIWSTSRILWRLRRRESYLGKCGQCKLWPSCRGCRAVAYAYSKTRGTPDIFADDPQCWLTRTERSAGSD